MRFRRRLRLGQYQEAVAAAAEFRDIFGKGNFYCEVMDHGLSIEKNVAADLMRLAKELDLPFVATNDLHYTKHEDYNAHAALLCVQSGSTLEDPTASNLMPDNFYLRSPEEMYSILAIFPGMREHPSKSLSGATLSFNTKANYMPNFPVP